MRKLALWLGSLVVMGGQLIPGQEPTWQIPPQLRMVDVPSFSGVTRVQAGDGLLVVRGPQGLQHVRVELLLDPSTGLAWWRFFPGWPPSEQGSFDPLGSLFSVYLSQDRISAAWIGRYRGIYFKEMVGVRGSLEKVREMIAADVMARSIGSELPRSWDADPQPRSCAPNGGMVFCLVSLLEPYAGSGDSLLPESFWGYPYEAHGRMPKGLHLRSLPDGWAVDVESGIGGRATVQFDRKFKPLGSRIVQAPAPRAVR